MNKVSVGYIFETVFWIDKASDNGPRLIAHTINGRAHPKKILIEDRRVLPGKRTKVKVQQVSESRITVEYLELLEFELEDQIYVDPTLKRQFEILLCSGRSILLEGPQGTGKTTISRALAKSLGMKYVFFNCSICFEPSDFAGALQLVIDEQGRAKTQWLPTEVLQAVYEANENPLSRTLIFLDELNRCRSHALNGIMSAIDSTQRIYDPRHNHYVPIPENVQWIAAVNRGKQFSGTYTLDLAQLDRFAILKLDYPPEDEEIAILHARYNMVSKKLVRKVVKMANLIRNDDQIMTDLSMRATDEICLFLGYPSYQRKTSKEDMIAIMTTSICNRLPGSISETGSEAQRARQLIERHILLHESVLAHTPKD